MPSMSSVKPFRKRRIELRPAVGVAASWPVFQHLLDFTRSLLLESRDLGLRDL
jgi:hypothetical protein